MSPVDSFREQPQHGRNALLFGATVTIKADCLSLSDCHNVSDNIMETIPTEADTSLSQGEV